MSDAHKSSNVVARFFVALVNSVDPFWCPTNKS
jgi:hypothetical protein